MNKKDRIAFDALCISLLSRTKKQKEAFAKSFRKHMVKADLMGCDLVVAYLVL